MKERGNMKIKKGVSIQEDGTRVEERGYCKRCARSLHELLKEHGEVEITALGSLAVANTMKAITICSGLAAEEGKELALDVPCYKTQDTEAGTSLAVFSIVVKMI